jgi:predicted restriction endonuclease
MSVPDEPVSIASADWYDKKEIHNKFTSAQNFNPLLANYRERFDLLLAECGNSQVTALDEDLEQIYAESTDPTERTLLIKARLGQGKFRKNVIEFWQIGETCVLTGISVRELLIASHIRSWRDCESSYDKLNGANGIILCAQADKLFDKHLLSFKHSHGNWETIISKRIDHVQLRRLGIESGMRLRSEHLSPSKESKVRQYLEEHLTYFNEHQG